MKTTIAKLVAIVLCFTANAFQAFSQTFNLDEVSGCLVTDVSGKVTFTEPGNPNPKSVTAGMVLSDDATVVVGKKANFTLVCDDRSLAFNKKGTHQMAMLSKDVQANGAASRFAKMAFAAKGYGTDTIQPRKKDPPKGWGGEDSILFTNPIGKKLIMQLTTFKWTNIKNGALYKFVVFEKTKDMPLLVATTSTAAFTVDPSQLAVKTGTVYHVHVSFANDPELDSEVLELIFVPKEVVESSLSNLMSDMEYKKSTPVQKALMEAAELEANGFHDLASERYQKAIRMDARNSLATQLYTAFLFRIN